MSSYTPPRNILSVFNPEEFNYTPDYFSTAAPLRAVNGSASLPTYSFASDINTGIYRVGADRIGISAGGSNVIDIDTSNVLISGYTNIFSATDTVFQVDEPGVPFNNPLFVVNGSTIGGQVLVGNGGAVEPTYSFINDTDSGLYRSGTNALGIAVGGAQITSFDSTGMTLLDSSARDVIRLGTTSTLIFNEDSNNNFSRLNLSNISNATANQRFFSIRFDGGNNGVRLDNNASFTCFTNNTMSLGNATRVWFDVWATDNTINTSDGTKKENIQDVIGLEFIKDLQPKEYKWKGRNRRHFGLLAQDVKEVLKKHGDFGGYIEDVNEDTGEPVYALRYGEFIAPMIKAIQELSNRVELLEKSS